MYRVTYECSKPWPKDGSLHIQETQMVYQIAISPEAVQRRTNSFLAGHVTMMAQAGEPTLILGDAPHWQVPVRLVLPQLGEVGILGAIEVDAQTGEIATPSSEQIARMQELAHAIAAHFTSYAARTS